MNLSDRWAKHLAELSAQGRYRQLRTACGVDFSSNDYLGYGSGARRRLFTPAEDLPRSGMASRLLRGQHELWEAVETRLASWHGAEAALVFPCGYMANEGLLGAVIEPGDWVASDELNHASIIDGLKLSKAERFIYRHGDLNHLEAGLASARRSAGRQLFVVTESLFGMEGTLRDPKALVDLCKRLEAYLIVDEAHATGCLGRNGCGLFSEPEYRQFVVATVHTGGKALGVPGAFVCGSARLKELLVNHCRHFLFTTALPPLVAAWWLETIELVKRDDEGRLRLQENARVFQAELQLQGNRCHSGDYIVPIIIGGDANAVAAAERLQAQGFDIRAIRPPTVPPGTARLRVSIHADHNKEQLVAAARAIAEVLR